MNITVTCNNCGQKLSAPGALAGRRVPCPKCKAPLDVPAAQGITAAPAASPGPAFAVPQVVPENPPRPVQPPAAPVVVDAGMIDLGLGTPLAPAARPAARPAGRSKRSLVPIIALVVLLFLAGGGVGAWLMLSGKGGVGGDLRYLPDDCDAVVSVNPNAIVSSAAGQKIKSRGEEMLRAFRQGVPLNTDLKPEDFGRATIGASTRGAEGAGVMHMNRAITLKDIPSADHAITQTIGGYQVNVVGDGAYCLIDDRTLVVGQSDAVRRVLERNGPAKISEALTAAMNETDFSAPFAIAFTAKNILGAGGAPVPIPGGPDGIRGGAVQADVGSDIRLRAVLLCKDATTADQIKTMAAGAVAAAKVNVAQLPPEAAKILNTVEITNSGSSVRGNLTIDVDSILSLVDQFKGLIPTAPSNPAAGESSPATRPLAGRTLGTTPGTPTARPSPALPSSGGNMRDAAARSMASNNLKQIALAMHGYHAAENHFPAPAICDSQGKPLLSWRVAILPQLGQTAIYKQFHLDESWDSPNNKRLINRVPAVYRPPQGSKPLGPGKTCLLAPIGERAAFFGQQGRKMTDFTDGLTNTILVVEAAPERAVPWTKPDDLTIDQNDPAAGLLGQREGGFLAAFGDGSVRFVPQAVDKNVLAALFTINGGETIPPNFGAK